MSADEWAAFFKGLACGSVGIIVAFGLLKLLSG